MVCMKGPASSGQRSNTNAIKVQEGPDKKKQGIKRKEEGGQQLQKTKTSP